MEGWQRVGRIRKGLRKSNRNNGAKRWSFRAKRSAQMVPGYV